MNNVFKESPFLVLLSNDKASSTTGVGVLVSKNRKFSVYISMIIGPIQITLVYYMCTRHFVDKNIHN